MIKKYWWIVGLFIAVLLTLLSPLASSNPDGLERVAEDHGFLLRAAEPLYRIIPDYLFPGISNEAVATVVAGLLGTLAVFAIVFGLAQLLKAQHTSRPVS